MQAHGQRFVLPAHALAVGVDERLQDLDRHEGLVDGAHQVALGDPAAQQRQHGAKRTIASVDDVGDSARHDAADLHHAGAHLLQQRAHMISHRQAFDDDEGLVGAHATGAPAMQDRTDQGHGDRVTATGSRRRLRWRCQRLWSCHPRSHCSRERRLPRRPAQSCPTLQHAAHHQQGH